MLQFPYVFNLNQIKTKLDNINALSLALKYMPLSDTTKLKIFHQEYLKSSLFSAKIEGNTLTLHQAKQLNLQNSQTKAHRELSNIVKTIELIKKAQLPLQQDILLTWHAEIMNQLHHPAGKMRSESSAIYDQYGNMVYLTPSPEEMKKMLDVLFGQINTQSNLKSLDQLALIANCHYYFEKIHPFIDGNGRLGRILLQFQLIQTGLFVGHMLPIEEYLNQNRSEYYRLLDKNTRKTEEFVIFIITAIEVSIQQLMNDIKSFTYNLEDFESGQLSQNQNQNLLLPRRKEILNIIKDHPQCTLEFIARRFPTIPKRTLAYDLQQLIKKNLINKLGVTKGVVYSYQEYKF